MDEDERGRCGVGDMSIRTTAIRIFQISQLILAGVLGI